MIVFEQKVPQNVTLISVPWFIGLQHVLTFLLLLPSCTWNLRRSFDNSMKFLVTNVESGAPLRPALLLSLSLQCLRLDTATNSLTAASLRARINTMTNHSTHRTQNIHGWFIISHKVYLLKIGVEYSLVASHRIQMIYWEKITKSSFCVN